MSGTKKSENAYVDSSAGENSSESNPAAKTIIHNGKTYFCHPIYINYAGSEDGYIINLKRLIPRKGLLNSTGYFQTAVYSDDGKKKVVRIS